MDKQELSGRIFTGICGAALCGGIAAATGEAEAVQIVGWSMIGLAIGGLLDLVVGLWKWVFE